MKSPSQPDAPDPAATAAAQSAINKDTAIAQTRLNQVDEYTPYGNSLYTPTGDMVDGIQRFRRDTTLNPEQQAIVDQQTAISGDLNTLAGDQIGRVSDNLATPFGFDGLPGAPTADAAARQQTIDALQSQFNSRLDPQFQQQQSSLETRLANQGIGVGSDAYNKAMESFGRTRNDAYQTAQNQAIAGGGAEQSRLFGLQGNERERAIQEYVTQRNAPLNEVSALMSGTQIQNPTFSPTPQTSIAAPTLPARLRCSIRGSCPQRRMHNRAATRSWAGCLGLLAASAAAWRAATAARPGGHSSMAIRNVSFYGQGQRAPLGGNAIQRAYQTDPRRQIEQQLLQTGASGAPVQSVGEGITRALSGIAGGYFAGQGRRDMETKEAERKQKMADVLASVGAPVESAPALNVPAEFADMGAALSRDPTAAEQQGRFVQGIAGIDPDAALSMQAQLMQNQMQQQQAAAAAAAEHERAEKDALRQRGWDVDDREDEQAARAALEGAKPDKFGAPYVVADEGSPTGWARVRTNQGGVTESLGAAPAPRGAYDPDAAAKDVTAKALGSRYDGAVESIAEADATLFDIEQMADLVGRVDSGAFAETKLAFAKTAQAMGFDVDAESIADAEAMKSKGMDFILQRIAKTKGAISEKEMRAFEAASAGIKNTPAGNRMILDLSRRVAERMKHEAQAVRRAIEAPGATRTSVDDAAMAARKEFGELFSAPEGGDNDPLGLR